MLRHPEVAHLPTVPARPAVLLGGALGTGLRLAVVAGVSAAALGAGLAGLTA